MVTIVDLGPRLQAGGREPGPAPERMPGVTVTVAERRARRAQARRSRHCHGAIGHRDESLSHELLVRGGRPRRPTVMRSAPGPARLGCQCRGGRRKRIMICITPATVTQAIQLPWQ